MFLFVIWNTRYCSSENELPLSLMFLDIRLTNIQQLISHESIIVDVDHNAIVVGEKTGMVRT